ncbi:hypothetical protein [Thermoanaerobacter mathranii]|uniref:hypothetical protein n=1 Tax=Thermoanaerobacter mathranii TaxID=583357 RepID=UPI003D6BAB86
MKKVITILLIGIFVVFSLIQNIPNYSADTQNEFILASTGKDGQWGTGDDIYATEKENAVQGTINTALYSISNAVPSNQQLPPLPPPPTGMQGYSPPQGTTATANSVYSDRTPDKAIDGNHDTEWAAASSNGIIQLTFPFPLSLSAVQIEMGFPVYSSVQFYIYGQKNGTWQQIGSATFSSGYGVKILSPISVTPGTYSAVKINEVANGFWADIHEITIIP